MQVQSLGCKDSLEKAMATRSSVLAQRMPWTEDPGGQWSTGLQSVRWEIPDISWDLLHCKKFNEVSKYGPHQRKKERKKVVE